MKTSYTATTIVNIISLSKDNASAKRLGLLPDDVDCRWFLCEVFKNSRVYVGFYNHVYGAHNVMYLNARESKLFVSYVRQLPRICDAMDEHIRETGCTNPVHAMLDAVFTLSGDLVCCEHPDCAAAVPTYCVLDGYVQDSLGHVVQLGISSPDHPNPMAN